MNDDPCMHAFGIKRDMNKTTLKFIKNVMDADDDFFENIFKI